MESQGSPKSSAALTGLGKSDKHRQMSSAMDRTVLFAFMMDLLSKVIMYEWTDDYTVGYRKKLERYHLHAEKSGRVDFRYERQANTL